MATTYKILYINEVGADFHNIEHDDHPGDFVTDLCLKLGDKPDEVQAFLVGVRNDINTRPWFIEPIEVVGVWCSTHDGPLEDCPEYEEV